MLLQIAWFELRRRFRMLSTYVYFAVFFGIGFLWMSLAGGAFPGASVDFGAGGKVFINAPLQLLFMTSIGGYLGTSLTAAIAGRATFQDVDHRTTSFFYTAPISKLDYLGGRYVGSFLAVMVLYPGLSLGAAAAMHSPFIDATRVGPAVPWAYVSPYLTILIPNLIFTSSIFFALATLLKKMVPVYVGAVVLVLGFLIATALTDNIENRTLASLIDPFGMQAAGILTDYWTIAEKNARVVPLSGVFLWNRLIWGGLGALFLALTYARFSFAPPVARRPEVVAAEPEIGVPVATPPVPHLDFGARASFAALLALTRLQIRETVRNVFFLVIVLAGVLFVVATGVQSDQIFGTKTWPVTYEVLEIVGGNFGLFILVIIAFYSGELVWRERDAGLAPIMDALPTARWVTFVSKLLALMFVQVLLAGVLLASGMGLQAAKGYFHFEPLVYLKTLFGVKLPSFWFLCTLAFFVHVLVNNKYVGHFLIVLYFIVGILLPLMGLEHYLYRIGSIPSWKYSDMNGFGHFAGQIALYQLYWGALAVVMAVASNGLWVRGAEASFVARVRMAWASRSRGATAVAGGALSVFAAAGVAIFWNTNVVTRYHTQHEAEVGQARWEKDYARWGDVPQPKVRAAKVDCDLFPEDRRAVLHGTYTIENATDAPMGQVIVRVHPDAEIGKFSLGRGEHASVSDPSLGFFVYDLSQPIAPHAKAALDFEVAFHQAGFSTSDVSKNFVENGTFFNSAILPHLGYSADLELADDAVRHKYGFAPRHLAPAGDPKESFRNAITEDADWVDFETTVSTSADQKAFAPGYLEREWTEGDRRYFHYVMDSKIFNLFGFLSGRYAVKRDHWSPPPGAMPGSKDVDIEIDYHPGHEFDLDRMVHGAKQSLDYFTTNFGPYQHRQVRIIEFPRYDRFAESLPNTIPFSESIGFIARVEDDKPDDIDYPFYVTAHEVAHQWWAHQVISANVQGATFLSETMAQYSALMVMKHEYGADKMKRFLRYELDRYLRGRSGAKRAELPLLRVENQPYIHYGKGSVVMYAFQDYVGEARLDATLAKFVAENKFQAPPYTDARAFVAALREATPPEYPHLVEDLFETITLFENRATKATYARRPDGKYDVEITIEAKKLRADEFGVETEIPLDDFIDVGVVDKDGKAILLERKKITEQKRTFTVTVDREPVKAGIDPMNKLVDRKPEDNVIAVEKKEGA